MQMNITPEQLVNDADLIRKFAAERDHVLKNIDTVWKPIHEELKKQKVKFLCKEDFLKIVNWKSSRAKGKAEINDPQKVISITKISFNLQDVSIDEDILDETRIEILTLLDGVQIPVASVLLTVLDHQRYTIIDKWVRTVIKEISRFREIEWKDTPSKRWVQYCKECRKISSELNVSLRDFDNDLWQYGKSSQNR